MTDQTCEEKAGEIIELLKMWEISLADAYVISRHMKFICQNTNMKDWNNPLDGTPYKAESIVRPEDVISVPENFSFDKPN